MQEGHRYRQPLVSDLGSFPLFVTTLSSPLRPGEICSRVAERIAQPTRGKSTLALTGSTSPSAFKVRVRRPLGSRAGPVLLGKMQETPDGSHLNICVRPHHFATCWAVGWAPLLVVALLAQEVCVVFLVLIVYPLTCGRLWWRFQYEGRLLLDVLNEECPVTLQPRVERPQTF